jgi:hypothetical protein
LLKAKSLNRGMQKYSKLPLRRAFRLQHQKMDDANRDRVNMLKTLHLNVKHLGMRLLYYDNEIIIVTLVIPVTKVYILLLKLMP